MRTEEREALVRRFEQVCREHGLALTVQRRTIFEAVLDRRDHPTADDVFERVRKRLPTVSRTTVYRVLDALDRAGAVMKISHPGTPARYEPCIQRHHHLVCRECGTLIDFENAALDGLALPDVRNLGFEISDFCVQFRGVCAACRGAKGTANSTPPERANNPGGRRTARRRKTR